MTDSQPTPTILDHAREAVRLMADARKSSSFFLNSRSVLDLHVMQHYADIAAALIAAHERITARDKALDRAMKIVKHYPEVGAALIAASGRAETRETRRAAELEAAYREGFEDGDCYRNGPNPTPEGAGFRAWRESLTKASLDQPGDAQEKEAAP